MSFLQRCLLHNQSYGLNNLNSEGDTSFLDDEDVNRTEYTLGLRSVAQPASTPIDNAYVKTDIPTLSDFNPCWILILWLSHRWTH